MDIRPVAHIIGILVAFLGVAMFIPAGIDYFTKNENYSSIVEAAFITIMIGGVTFFATQSSGVKQLDIRQIFLLTVGAWVILPLFAALPYMIGAPHVSFTDGYFEAVSGLTTTGSTVFNGLDYLPKGANMWRAMTQWFGGIGIVVVAVAFLPAMNIGGMQFFRSEGFDTFGKVLPRAGEISFSITRIYAVLTFLCFLSYRSLGLSPYDATFHALTTLSTGGFSNYDASFKTFSGAPEYVACFFMVSASLPFVRYIQMTGGSFKPFFQDAQVKGFFTVIAALTTYTILYRLIEFGDHFKHALREGLFNIISILSGTGYASEDYQQWGSSVVVLFFLMGLIGGCAGSTCCSVKIFRYQIMFSAIVTRLRKVDMPNSVEKAFYQGRPITDDLLSSVVAFFMVFLLSLAIVTIALSMTGLDPVTAISGAATSLANIGPGLGNIIGPTGNFAPLPDNAKVILTFAMLLGRLELLSVFVILMPRFWRW